MGKRPSVFTLVCHVNCVFLQELVCPGEPPPLAQVGGQHRNSGSQHFLVLVLNSVSGDEFSPPISLSLDYLFVIYLYLSIYPSMFLVNYVSTYCL